MYPFLIFKFIFDFNFPILLVDMDPSTITLPLDLCSTGEIFVSTSGGDPKVYCYLHSLGKNLIFFCEY